MTTDWLNLDDAFGDPDCETEVRRLKGEFSSYYFDETAFNKPAMRRRTYLIVGRRGSGKTALTRYFSFQDMLPNARAIDVDEPDVFQKVMDTVDENSGQTRTVSINNIAKTWDYVLWCLVLNELKDLDPAIAKASAGARERGPVMKLIYSVLESVIERATNSEVDLKKCIDDAVGNEVFAAGCQAARRIAKEHPVIIAVDSLEQYEVENQRLMDVIAGLVQSAYGFNNAHSQDGIHVKVFLSGEIFPYLRQEVLLNPLKHAKGPVYLVWRNKDLLRLICWRFHRFLVQNGVVDAKARSIKWNNHRDVYEKVWKPYFGETLKNESGLEERTFPYLCRHTHMRPRQVIWVCNHVARLAMEGGRFPRFAPEDLRRGVRRAELELADEVVNSYSSIYPEVSRIISTLKGFPAMFEARELDRVAPQSKKFWSRGGNDYYSPDAFRALLAQLGVVGRLHSKENPHSHVSVDFEYSIQNPLPISSKDTCAIHPMFYQHLNVQNAGNKIVYPFLIQEEHEDRPDTFFRIDRP